MEEAEWDFDSWNLSNTDYRALNLNLTSSTCTGLDLCNETFNDTLKDPAFFSHRYRLVGTIFQARMGVLGSSMTLISNKMFRP